MTAEEVRAVYADARFTTASLALSAAQSEAAAAEREFRAAWRALPKATADALTRLCRAAQARESAASS